MKHILIGDTHFDVANGSEDVFNQQIKVFKEQIFDEMDQRGITSIIQTGDITDNRTKLSINIQHNLKKELFDVLEKNNYKLTTILGNHDINKKNTLNIYSMEIFEKAYPNTLRVIKDNTMLNNILLVPWLVDSDSEVKMFKDIDNYKPKGVIGHFEIANFHVSKTYKSEHGIKRESFKDVKVLSGHYHLKQSGDNIEYIGTPYQDNWTSFGEENGFYIIDDETLEMEFIRNISTAIHLKVYLDSENKEMEVTDGITIDKFKLGAKTDYSIFDNQKVKIYLDKDNAFNKKQIEKIIENVINYRIEILEEILEDEDTVQDEKFKEYDISKSISEQLDNDYQKQIFNEIHIKSLTDMKE